MKNQAFTEKELIGMADDQTAHMLDTCRILTRTETLDTFGQKVETWVTVGEEITCGLEMSPGAERLGIEGTAIQYDGILRLPMDQPVNIVDRVKITKRFGIRQETQLIYQFVSPIQSGASGTRYALRRIET
jgi:hypothetical protein